MLICTAQIFHQTHGCLLFKMPRRVQSVLRLIKHSFLPSWTPILFSRQPAKCFFHVRVSGQPVLLLPFDGLDHGTQDHLHPEARPRPPRERRRREGGERTGAQVQGGHQRKRDTSKKYSRGNEYAKACLLKKCKRKRKSIK